MYLTYGPYRHALAECMVQIQKEALTDQAGRRYGIRERWNIEGFLIADTQAAITTAIKAMERAYETNFQSLVLLLPDGVTPSAHSLPGVTKLGGTRIVSGPSFGDGKGAEYTTYRTYQIVAECEYPQPGIPDSIVLSQIETLSFSGGGPRFVYLQPINGKPQRQRTADATPYRVSQQGQAVGMLSYPRPAAPLWPAAEHRDQRQITTKTPKRVGNKYSEFEISWVYQFESSDPLNGQSERWRT